MSSCLTTVELLRCASGDASAVGLEHLDACEACAAALAAALRAGESSLRDGDFDDPWAALSDVPLDDRYVVERKLGEGGMGVVLLAFDRNLERKVALKIVRTLGEDAEGHLRRESRLMAGLRHPNVVTVFDIGEFDGGAFVSMESVEGSTLREWVTGRSRAEIMRAYRQAAEGLDAAHTAGIVHRDFKPDNVLVDQTGRAMVTDFGLASRSLPSGPGVSQEATSRWGGTLPYMSPEQLDGKPLDARADIYAFGVALWEALSGERPYDGVDVDSQREAIDTPPTWPRAVPRVPRRLGRLLRACVAVDREARPSSLRPVIDALEPRASVGRWVGIAGSASAVVGLAAWTMVEVPNPRQARCETHDVRSMGASEEADVAVFAEGDRAHAKAWLEQMQGFSERWQAQTLAWCDANAEIDALADAQWSCLARARSHFDLLWSHVLEAPADARVARLEEGLARIAELPSLRACEQPSIPPMPDEVELAERVRSDREVLSYAELLGRFGGAERAAELLDGLETSASMQFRPFAAERQLALATLASEDHQQGLRQVVEVALASGHDRVAVRAWQRMVRNLVEVGDKGGRAEEYLAYAAAAVERLGTPDDLQSMQLLETGALLLDAGRSAEAHDAFVAAARIAPTDGPDHEVALSGQANALSDLGRGEEALEILGDLLERRRERYSETSLPVARSYIALSQVYGDMERVGESADAAAKATVVLEALLGADHLFLAYSLHNEADARYRGEELSKALELETRARDIARAKAGPRSALFSKTSHTHARILGAMGRFDDALAVIAEARDVAYEIHGERHIETAGVELAFALLLRDAGKLQEARPHAERALEIYETVSGSGVPSTARARHVVGKILVQLGERAEGAAQLERALQVLETVEGGDAAVTDVRAALAEARG